ncbi:MAG: DUF3383 family protein [Myxococcota bacterium]
MLASLPPARAGFGNALYLVDKATNTLGGTRVVSYSSAADVAAALLATQISATTAAQLTAAFTQQPTPSKIKVAFRDTALSETMTAALAAIEAVDTDWYGTAIYSRTAADIVAWAALIEARKKLFVAQTTDVLWLAAGVPAAFSAISAYERTVVIYHDTSSVAADLCWLVSRLVFNPDNQSAPWEGQVRGVASYAANLTAAQRDFAVGNDCNVGLPFSSAAFYVSPGVNQNARSIYEMVTADWLAARISEDLQALKLAHTDRGDKIIVDPSGQGKVMAILQTRLAQGEGVGHFGKGQTRPTAEPITAGDIAAKRLRFKVEAQIAADARLFQFNVYLQPTALQALTA